MSEAPTVATPAARQLFGTADLVVCHDVFEHLRRPENAALHLNAMLRIGGVLVWSSPLMIHEHGGEYGDWHRFPTREVRRLLRCSGFEVRMLHGLGSAASLIAYLAG